MLNRLELQKQLRIKRAKKCFPVINRGKLWYDKLSYEQLMELSDWYECWLNCTETLIAPDDLDWVNKQIEEEEDIL